MLTTLFPVSLCWLYETDVQTGQGHRFTGVQGHCEGGRLDGGRVRVKLGGCRWTGCGRVGKRRRMTILSGPDCTTMTDVRAGVDALDRELVALLAKRFAYMDAAARIKPERGHVRDEARKAQVIENARAEAVRLGVPDAMVADLWETLVEASIAYELAAFDRR